MLSIHYVSTMMRIFYIDWQQHWKCDRTMNIDQWSTKAPQVTDLHRPVDSWVPVTSERHWASFQVTRLFHKATVSHCDHFLLQHMCLLFETSPGWSQGSRGFFFFFTSIWWGSTQLQCIYYLRRILISRPPSVFRRFKRRSCSSSLCGIIAVCSSNPPSACLRFKYC